MVEHNHQFTNAIEINDYALALLSSGRAEEAVDLLTAGISEFPASRLIRSNLAYALKYDPRANGHQLKKAAEAWAALFEADRRPRPRPPLGAGRLRVGYISPDFQAHPVGFFMDGVLACHDPARVEVYCYSNTLKIDPQTSRLRGSVAHWREIEKLDDVAVADLIKSDGIHVLVDIAGHTRGSRLSVLAHEPAPVLVNWVLGGAGTTGMKAVDYVLADQLAIPPEQESLYVEKVARLPRCYLAYCPPGNAPEIRPAPCSAAGVVTFGCFNNLAKVNQDAVTTWAGILRRIDNSRLMFQTSGYEDPEVRRRISGWMAACGVDGSRLIFGEGKLSQIEFLERHADIDIGLDPFPYAGGMTTCDALWMGVPVVTLPGEGVHARHGATILTNAGLRFCVAQTKKDYADIAIRLASNIPALAELRRRLRPHLMSSSLCNVVGLTHDLEQTFERMCSGPRPISIPINTP